LHGTKYGKIERHIDKNGIDKKIAAKNSHKKEYKYAKIRSEFDDVVY